MSVDSVERYIIDTELAISMTSEHIINMRSLGKEDDTQQNRSGIIKRISEHISCHGNGHNNPVRVFGKAQM